MDTNVIRSLGFFTVLSTGLMISGPSANAAVVLLEESRDVRASAFLGTPLLNRSSDFTNRSPGDFSDFNETLEVGFTLPEGSANAVGAQFSQISKTSITASGEATASAEVKVSDSFRSTSANANANSNLSVKFELTDPTSFELSGTVSSLGTAGFPSGSASVSLSDDANTFDLSFQTHYSQDVTVPFDINGTLFPGVYNLRAAANMGASVYGLDLERGSSEFSVDFLLNSISGPELSSVPVPAALWLFASGMLGLIGIARRQVA